MKKLTLVENGTGTFPTESQVIEDIGEEGLRRVMSGEIVDSNIYKYPDQYGNEDAMSAYYTMMTW